MLAWLSVWSEVQTCIWPSWCHCHSLSLASVKFRLVLPFWYRLTQVVLEKGPLNGCVCVSRWYYTSDVNKATSVKVAIPKAKATTLKVKIQYFLWNNVQVRMKNTRYVYLLISVAQYCQHCIKLGGCKCVILHSKHSQLGTPMCPPQFLKNG